MVSQFAPKTLNHVSEVISRGDPLSFIVALIDPMGKPLPIQVVDEEGDQVLRAEFIWRFRDLATGATIELRHPDGIEVVSWNRAYVRPKTTRGQFRSTLGYLHTLLAKLPGTEVFETVARGNIDVIMPEALPLRP
jgi:hypothetical protein